MEVALKFVTGVAARGFDRPVSRNHPPRHLVGIDQQVSVDQVDGKADRGAGMEWSAGRKAKAVSQNSLLQTGAVIRTAVTKKDAKAEILFQRKPTVALGSDLSNKAEVQD